MTLITVGLGAQRVLLLTDTLMIHSGQPWCFTVKYRHLPHCSAAVAARGPTPFLNETAERLDRTYLPDGAGTARLFLPGFLAGLHERLCARYPGTDTDGELVLIGWSPLDGRFVGWHFGHGDGFQAHELAVDHVHYWPHGRDGYRPLPMADDERLVALALAQHRGECEGTPPGRCAPVGGDLLALELRPGRATSWKAARLDGYAALAAAMAGEEQAA